MSTLRNCINRTFALSKACSHPSVTRKPSGHSFNFVRDYSKSYTGDDAKTHTVLLNDDTQSLMVSSYSNIGFSLNNGLSIVGPMALFPNCVLSWNVGHLNDINEDSLSLFFKLEPKIDILILGIPDYKKKDRKVLLGLADLVRRYKIQVEVMPTEIACPTFNFLHDEKRFVAAGIIPPFEVDGVDAEAMDAPYKLGFYKDS